MKKQYSTILDNEVESKKQLNERADFAKKEYNELLEKYYKVINE